jgi:hypothetical protein
MLRTSLTEKITIANLSEQIKKLKERLREFESAGQMYQINPFDKSLIEKRDTRIRNLLEILPGFVGSLSGFGGKETRCGFKINWNRSNVINHIKHLEQELGQRRNNGNKSN